MQPTGQGRILEARQLGKLGGRHPAAFELGQEDTALFLGRADPAFGVDSDRPFSIKGPATAGEKSELFAVVIVLIAMTAMRGSA